MLKNSNKKLETAIILGLSVVLVVTLIIGIVKDRNLTEKNTEEYNEFMVEYEANKKKDKSDQTLTDNLYNKLRKKEDVKILILGDGIVSTQTIGSENGIFGEGVKKVIETTYGSKVELKLLAKNGASSEVGVETVKNNDISGYDLVIICYGHNDNETGILPEKFKDNYQEIVDEIKKANPNATIIPIVPSTLDSDNKYSNVIKEVSNSNELNFADMKLGFVESNLGEYNLGNGGFPNDAGYNLYIESIGKIIEENIKE